MRVGLLVNFHGYPNVDIRRVFLGDMTKQGSVEDVSTGQISQINICHEPKVVTSRRAVGAVIKCANRCLVASFL